MKRFAVLVFSVLSFIAQDAEARNPWKINRKVDAVTDSVTVTLTNFGREWDGLSSKINIGSLTLRCKQGQKGSVVTLSVMSPKLWRHQKPDVAFFQESDIYFRFDKQDAILFEGWRSYSLGDVESLTCPDSDVPQILNRIYSGDHRVLVVRSQSPFNGQTWTMRFKINDGEKMVERMFSKCR